jgi:hypothetical protein
VRDLPSRARLLVVFPFRVDAKRTAGTMVLFTCSQVAGIGSAVALGVITNAVIRGSRSEAIWGSVLLVLSIVVAQAARWGSFVLDAALTEKTALMTDQELTALLVKPVGIEHLERPEFLDRVDYLRQNKSQLTAVPSYVTQREDVRAPRTGGRGSPRPPVAGRDR